MLGMRKAHGALGALKRKVRPKRSTATQLPNINFFSGLGGGGWLLHGLVYALKPEVCVEIGSARGFSACHVGLALKELGRGKLYAIDPHAATEWNDDGSVQTLQAMTENLTRYGVREQVEIMLGYSRDFAADWKLPIDLLFIDGDHSYEGVRTDWELYSPYLKPEGVAVFHDTAWELSKDSEWNRDDMGVPRLVEELRMEGYPVISFLENFGISIIQPVKGGFPLA